MCHPLGVVLTGLAAPAGAGILLALALVTLGAVWPAPRALTVGTAGLLYVIYALRHVFNSHGDQHTTVVSGLQGGGELVPAPLLPALLLPLLVLVQLTAGVISAPSAASAYDVTSNLLLLTSYAAFFAFAYGSTTNTRVFHAFAALLLLLGTAEGLYGLLNLLSGNERLLIYERWAYPHSATGTLVNRNHFAYLIEMSLPLALASGLLFAPVQRDTRRSTDSEATARRIMAVTATTVLGLALIFSRSRMGIFSLLAAAATIGAASALLRPRAGGRSRKGYALPALLVLALGGFALVIGIDPVLERFFRIPQDLEHGRLPIWKAALAMWREAPLLGHGWGSYESLWPAWAGRPTGLHYKHAHNEYLQVLAEGGLAGATVVAWALWLFGRRVLRALSRPLTHAQRAVTVALATGITSVAFHSAADFGLRIPGVALVFALVVALFVRVTDDPELVDRA